MSNLLSFMVDNGQGKSGDERCFECIVLIISSVTGPPLFITSIYGINKQYTIKVT